MKRALGLVAFALLIVLLALSGDKAWGSNRPNVLLVQTDDQTMSLLRGKYRDDRGRIVPIMPNVAKIMLQGGTQFQDYYASTPICGPSRASLLSGQLAHNTGVVVNRGRFGGWEGWANSHIYSQNLAVALQNNGYHTAHFGKLTNYYGEVGPTGTPPGWSTWVTDSTDDSSRDYYGYSQYWKIDRLGHDAEQGTFGAIDYTYSTGIDPKECSVTYIPSDPCNYHTDKMTLMAADEIAANTGKPFYIQVDYHAPHGDDVWPGGSQPATRHIGKAKRAVLPGAPGSGGFSNLNFNEKSTNDKPFVMKRVNGPMRNNHVRNTQTIYRNSIEALQSVDEGVAMLVQTLRDTGKEGNTYVIYMTDNGFFLGDHRFTMGKALAYEEAARLPFAIKGPGVPAGAVSKRPTSTVDVAATILDITGTSPAQGQMQSLDGVSMRPGWEQPSAKPRRLQVIEWLNPLEMAGIKSRQPATPTRLSANRPAGASPLERYMAIKIGPYKYTKYDNGGGEIYDLRYDPSELYNQMNNPAYRKLVRWMHAKLNQARTCSGASCWADPGAPPKPGRFTTLVDTPLKLKRMLKRR